MCNDTLIAKGSHCDLYHSGDLLPQESVMLQFCGNKLDKKDFFGKSDPFLVFYRSNEDGS